MDTEALPRRQSELPQHKSDRDLEGQDCNPCPAKLATLLPGLASNSKGNSEADEESAARQQQMAELSFSADFIPLDPGYSTAAAAR